MRRIALGAFLTAAIVQFGAAPGLAQSAMCKDPQAFCGRQMSESCLSRLGAGVIAAAGVDDGACAAQAELYRDCLSLVAGQCGGGSAAPKAEASRGDQASMLAIWAEVKDSNSPAALESFAKSYPNTPLAALATERAANLRAGTASGSAGKALDSALDRAAAMAPMTPENAALRVQEAATRENQCQQQALNTPSGQRVATFFITDVNDTMQAHKMEIDAFIDANLAAAIVDHRNRASACQARFLSDVADFSAQLVAITATMLARQEDLTAEAMAHEITIGEVNAQIAAIALELQGQATALFLNAAASGTWSTGGPAEQAQAASALGQWTASQKRLARSAPGTRVFACSWSAGGVSC